MIDVSDSEGDDIAEVFSVPRVSVAARAAGLRASISLDVLTGDDLSTFAGRRRAVHLVEARRPLLLILSPPCTMFSILNRNCHHRRALEHPGEHSRRLAEAEGFVDFSVHLAMEQRRHGRFFVFEHPASASSWQLPSLGAALAAPGVVRFTFDQCRFGLVSPRGAPLKKGTAFLTNSQAVVDRFANRRCQCTVPHHPIQGQEWGLALAAWAGKYPPPLCAALAAAAAEERARCREAQGDGPGRGQLRAWHSAPP